MGIIQDQKEPTPPGLSVRVGTHHEDGRPIHVVPASGIGYSPPLQSQSRHIPEVQTSLGSGLGSATLSGGHNHGLNEHPQTSHVTSDESETERKVSHILLAVSGSVASIKIPLIINRLKSIYHDRAEIQLVVTRAAEHFLTGLKIPTDVKVYYDRDEWTSRRGRAESMLHVKLRRWADILVIAPLSANTLAKIVNGICNNLLTSVIRVWNPDNPILIAPAMNTHMYTNPMTKKHLQIIKDDYKWIEVLKPVEKVLVCGDIGMGGMREWSDVVHALVTRVGGLPEQNESDEDDNEATRDDEDEDEDDQET